MKVYFFGSLISDKSIDDIVSKSKIKPSNAPVNFSNMFVKALTYMECDVEIHSLPTVSNFPNGSLLFWGRRKEKLACGEQCIWIPAINLMFVKQFSATISSYFSLLYWLIKNRKEKDKIVVNYSVYPPYSMPTVKLCKLFKCENNVIITDLPEYLYNMHDDKGLRQKLNLYFTKKLLKYQDKFNSYILLTKSMADRIKISHMPNIIVEGFSDDGIFQNIPKCEKHNKKVVMYAGNLNEKFGIRKLLDSFTKVSGDYELWLYGGGNLEEYIKSCSGKDKRIKFFGKVSREELLSAQKKAHILISVKPTDEDHSNYAFPSKILEYMTSGTAVLSTRVGGIPEEYFKYIYPIDDETSVGITNVLKNILDKPTDELVKKGEYAKKFVFENKSYKIQGEKIYDFYESL